MISLWTRTPVVVRAVLVGLVLAVAGTAPWVALSWANVKYWPAVPWAVPPAVLYLWLFWRYLRGDGWPRSTAEARRTLLRANRLTDEVWGAALFAGILGLVTVVLLLGVMNRLVSMPAEQLPDLSRVSYLTLLFILPTGSAVAGVVEEASFRGYMQGPIERRHGPVIAILLTSSLFGLAHFTHEEFALIQMPYYLAAAAVYGTLAYLTNSILPGLVLHAGGDFFMGGMSLLGLAEGQESSKPSPLIWESGTDASFWISFVAFVIAAAATVWAYAALAKVARKAPPATAT